LPAGILRLPGALTSLIFAAIGAGAAAAAPTAAADTEASPQPISIAIWHIDALGIEPEIVGRLESLFRMELERLARRSLPSRREVERALDGAAKLRQCTGETVCLAAIGQRLGVALVVSGNVAQLGDSYIINLKLVDTASGEEVRRIASDPLRGNPDELIEAVRVAAYRLVAPDALHGSIAILTDLYGAKVTLDGAPIGTTPLASPITGLALGDHTLRVTADNYTPFAETVRVRFQKTTRVVVRLILAKPRLIDPGLEPMPGGPAAPEPWYSSPWVAVGVAVAAIALGGTIGYRLGRDPVVDCAGSPSACD
jgi:hypothetical protein